MVARMVRDHEVVGSNPVTPTKKRKADDAKCVARFSFVTGFEPQGGASDQVRIAERLCAYSPVTGFK